MWEEFPDAADCSLIWSDEFDYTGADFLLSTAFDGRFMSGLNWLKRFHLTKN